MTAGSSAQSMVGRVCLITGATSGLGLATADALAALGARVVIAGRSPASCAEAAEYVRARTGSDEVDWLAADLSRQDEVRRLADEFKRRYAQLHVLINNAGAVFQARSLTPEGVERTFAINHLAPFLLTTELLETLRASAPARVIAVASVAHEQGKLDLGDLELRRGYRPFRAYSRSKLANLLFTYELARRLDGTGVTANALNPGLVRTGLGAKGGRIVGLGWRLIQYRHRRASVEPEEGARTIVHLAESPVVAGVSGRYFERCAERRSSPAARDPVAGAALWAVSEDLTRAARPARDR